MFGLNGIGRNGSITLIDGITPSYNKGEQGEILLCVVRVVFDTSIPLIRTTSLYSGTPTSPVVHK